MSYNVRTKYKLEEYANGATEFPLAKFGRGFIYENGEKTDKQQSVYTIVIGSSNVMEVKIQDSGKLFDSEEVEERARANNPFKVSFKNGKVKYYVNRSNNIDATVTADAIEIVEEDIKL